MSFSLRPHLQRFHICTLSKRRASQTHSILLAFSSKHQKSSSHKIGTQTTKRPTAKWVFAYLRARAKSRPAQFFSHCRSQRTHLLLNLVSTKVAGSVRISSKEMFNIRPVPLIKTVHTPCKEGTHRHSTHMYQKNARHIAS